MPNLATQNRFGNTWRRVRVLVEVPVRGEYTEKDLRYHVERLVGGAKLNTRPGEGQTAMGRVEVKVLRKGILLKLLRELLGASANRTEEARRRLKTYLDQTL